MSGGVNAFTNWQSIGWIPITSAAIDTIPGCPKFPSSEELLDAMQHKRPWHDHAYIERALKEHGFDEVQVEEHVKTHVFDADSFVHMFGGPMIQAMASSFWSKEDLQKYGSQVAPALKKYLQDNGQQEISFLMIANIAVAKKA